MISTVTTTTTTTVTTADVMTYSIIAVVTLIGFLAVKEVLSSDETGSERVKALLSGSNIAIVPLLIVFAAIVVYRVLMVL